MTAALGCRWCGVERRGHGQRWIAGDVGLHRWTKPTREQIHDRMRKRLGVPATTDCEPQP